MHIRSGSIFVLPSLVIAAACSPSAPPQDTAIATQGLPPMKSADETVRTPPAAEVRPHELMAHTKARTDNYYWLRDDERTDPDVLAYLEAENDYTRRMLAHTEALQEQLYEELVARIDPDDATVPERHGEYWYYRRYEPGQEQPIHARRRGGDGAEEILLNENTLGEGYEYYRIGNYEVSPDGLWLAYAEDTVSRQQYDIRIKNLRDGTVLPDVVRNASSAMAWANDNATLYYVKLQDETLIPYQIWRHRAGSGTDEDTLVYEEGDPGFSMWLARTRDDTHIAAYLSSTLSSEVRLLDLASPDGGFVAFLPRETEHEYNIDLLSGMAYIHTNWQAKNFRVMRAALATGSDKSTWQEVVAERDEVLIGSFVVFDDYLVLGETSGALEKLNVIPLNGGDSRYIDSAEPVYAASIDDNPNTDTSVLRYAYSSLTTPTVIYDLDLATGERTLRKQAFAGPDFDAQSYATARLEAPARDGTGIPVSLLFRRGSEPDGRHPLYILGYGAYGLWYEPTFRRDILSLVDRGFVFAIAHIRGGQELGRRWYEDGKLLNKKNTFTDFVDVSRHLVEAGWGHPEKVVGMGRSAGGLLIGAVANMAPDAFTVLVTEVPFVDVVTTMLDESIPLTTFEYDEWGNPGERTYYDYMLSYSPYDRVSKQRYPHMLVTTGLWDSQVQYWEPAKWVAKLRTLKTGDNRLLLHTDMSAGHGGASGRFKRLHERAREYAFILDTLGLARL